MASLPAQADKASKSTLVSVEEYRTLLNDRTSSDEQIIKRLVYLEAFCRNVARMELEKYVEDIKTKRKATN